MIRTVYDVQFSKDKASYLSRSCIAMSIWPLRVWLVPWLVPVLEALDTSEETRGMGSIPQLNCAEAMLVFG